MTAGNTSFNKYIFETNFENFTYFAKICHKINCMLNFKIPFKLRQRMKNLWQRVVRSRLRLHQELLL